MGRFNWQRPSSCTKTTSCFHFGSIFYDIFHLLLKSKGNVKFWTNKKSSLIGCSTMNYSTSNEKTNEQIKEIKKTIEGTRLCRSNRKMGQIKTHQSVNTLDWWLNRGEEFGHNENWMNRMLHSVPVMNSEACSIQPHPVSHFKFTVSVW